jgi:hypothetical protein
MNSVIVLIIAHQSNPSRENLASLKQCQKILKKYPIVLVCPSGLDVSEYRKTAPDVGFDFIDPHWQSNYRMFNRLKIDPFLYKRYRQFDYILFYELDAWVFRDELQYWCSQGYDYLGAPWFEGYRLTTSKAQFLGVGNGGFSLRKVKSHLRVLYSFSYIKMPRTLLREFLDHVTPAAFIELLTGLTFKNNTYYLFNTYSLNEDIFWGNIVTRNFDWFKVPDMAIASRFSMELNAPSLYKSNGDQLPFGCHKWEKYHAEFWKRFIQIEE